MYADTVLKANCPLNSVGCVCVSDTPQRSCIEPLSYIRCWFGMKDGSAYADTDCLKLKTPYVYCNKPNDCRYKLCL